MGKLEEQADWGALVHQAVDDFLEELERRHSQREYEALGSSFDVRSVAFREQLELYSATLLASAAVYASAAVVLARTGRPL